MRKVIAVLILVVLFLPFALTTLGSVALSTWLLDRSFYVGLVDSPQLYEALVEEGAGSPEHSEAVLIPGTADGVPAGAMSDALRSVLPGDYFRGQAVSIVNQAFDFFDGHTAEMDLYWDLVPVKQALMGEGSARFADSLAGELPTCAAGEDPLAPGGQLPRCRPASVSIEAMAQRIGDSLPAYVNRLPDRVRLNEADVTWHAGVPGRTLWLAVPASAWLWLMDLILLAPTLALWLVAALVGGDNARERLLWLGWSMIAPAAAIFLLGLIVHGGVALGWATFAPGEVTITGLHSTALGLAMSAVAHKALRVIANSFLAVGGLAGGLSLALIVAGAALARGRRAAISPAPSSPSAPAA